jgi:hypothetical protein
MILARTPQRQTRCTRAWEMCHCVLDYIYRDRTCVYDMEHFAHDTRSRVPHFRSFFRYWTTERPRGVQSQYHAVRRMCRERGVLFDDPEFPPGPRVLFHHKKPPVHPILWMRPGVSRLSDGSGTHKLQCNSSGAHTSLLFNSSETHTCYSVIPVEHTQVTA